MIDRTKSVSMHSSILQWTIDQKDYTLERLNKSVEIINDS